MGTTWREADLRRDRNIEFKDANKHGDKWQRYGPLKERLEKIFDKDYQDATDDFRHKYHHRFSPRIVLGITQLVKRNTQAKPVSYSLGGVPPLTLELIVKLLSERCTRSYAAFEAFQQLIREHEESISKYEASHNRL
jgi:hypothetical protein